MSGKTMSSHHKLALVVLLFVHLFHIPSVSSVGWELLEDAELRKAVILKREEGQDNWCYQKAECKEGASGSVWEQGACKTGQKQSPINFGPALRLPISKNTINFSPARAKYVLPTYNLKNTGRTILVTPPENHGMLFHWKDDDGKDRTFELAQIDFHWGPQNDVGSEHAIAGKFASMEMHLVHFNKRFPDFKAARESGQKDALAVIGVQLVADPSKIIAGSDLAPIVDNLEKVAKVGSSVPIASSQFDIRKFIPLGTHGFTYEGSLTTPGCNEVVNWVVIRNPHSIKPADVAAFRTKIQADADGTLLQMNYRKLQNSTDRPVELALFS